MKTIATYSLVGALVAGAVIIFLSMLMIVRERRREIGVLKAIGSSNAKISWQFVTEALTLTGMAAVVGVVIGGVILSNPVLDVLGLEQLEHRRTARRLHRRGPGGGTSRRRAGGGPIRIGGGTRAGASPQFGDVLSNVQAHVGFEHPALRPARRRVDRGRRHRIPLVADRQGPPRRSDEDGVVMLQVTDLSKTFGSGDTEVKAVDGVTFTVPTGVFAAVVGRSGSGKSTLLSLLGALDKPTSGSIEVDGEVISQRQRPPAHPVPPQPDRLRVPELQPDPEPRARSQNVMLPMEFAGRVASASGAAAPIALLEQVGLKGGKQQRRPAKLSGGEQQRVAIARALGEPAQAHPRRRAHRQPRLQDRARDREPAPRAGALRADDDPRGDARPHRRAAHRHDVRDGGRQAHWSPGRRRGSRRGPGLNPRGSTSATSCGTVEVSRDGQLITEVREWPES